jgi:hypothetical protein
MEKTLASNTVRQFLLGETVVSAALDHEAAVP